MNQNTTKLCYTTKELVEVTSVNKDYWRMLQRLGILTPIRMGKKDIWLKEDIDNFLNWARHNEVANEFEIKQSLAKSKDYR